MLAIVAGSAVLVASNTGAPSANASPPAVQAPGWTLTSPQGQVFRYPEDLDRPAIVFFWATWCPYCKALMPHLQSILDEYGGATRVLAITIREDGDPAAVLAEHGYAFEWLGDGDAVAESWGVRGTPGLFLADASGQVRFSRAWLGADEFPAAGGKGWDDLSNAQKAARMAPFWAARLRQALDAVLAEE